ncbi:MAG: amino acid ABC transporter substrate-binding protein [Erysipelotrichales bacterium]
MKKILKGLLLMFVMIGAVACSNEKKVESALDKEEIVMGLDDTFAPMGFKDTNGKLVGFDVDLADEVSKRINKKIKFQPIDWAMKETELANGNIDLIWNGYSITDERKEKVAFSDPYLDNAQTIVVLKDSPIKSKNDLEAKKVATQKDSSTQEVFKNDKSGIVAKFDGGDATYYSTFTDVFTDLDTKRSEAIVGDAVLVKYVMKQKGEEKYRALKDDFGTEQFGIGMRKDDTKLKEAIDNALKDIKKDGTFEKIYKKWFS